MSATIHRNGPAALSLLPLAALPLVLLPLGCAASGATSDDLGAAGSAPADTGEPPTSSASAAATAAWPYPSGWLFTKGNRILVSDGVSGGTPWMGRGVNVDDIFLCGYNDTLWMSAADTTLQTLFANLVAGWKPSFVRVSLAMNSHSSVTSWLTNPDAYKFPMIHAIDSLTAQPGVRVLVTLRSDVTMIGEDTSDGDPEATGIPSSAETTPDAAQSPAGTDDTYRALVDTFAYDQAILFGVSNEPGGNKLSDAQIAAAMNHAVGVIRAEEDRLQVPHHIVSVQGNSWTSDIQFYAATPAPITYDNVVYEVHGYPPSAGAYTYANLPVIVGEYGNLDANGAAALYADLEAKQIPNLAWDFDPFSDCSPDLLDITQSASSPVASAWGSIVQSYLLAHAR